MSCGKKKLVKKWDRPRKIRVVTPSRYEQNEASVKVHWRKVVQDMELSYRDDQFWEPQCDAVRNLLGPKIFRRIAKIFNLPLEATAYEPKSETSSLVSSRHYYTTSKVQGKGRSNSIISGYEEEEEEEEEEEHEISGSWSASTVTLESKKDSRHKSLLSKSQSIVMSKILQAKSFSRYFSKTLMKQQSQSKSFKSEEESSDSPANSDDDMDVRVSWRTKRLRRLRLNPFYEMLYCHESETDMIKWKSKYKVKLFEISASDEMSKKAELVTKQIARDFYDWWVGLGSLEFKSEIKRPEDIESLFQVWFDEHASRGLMLHPKILPCVLESIANYTGVTKTACPKVLKRQIAWDIDAETTPAHLTAFGTGLPHKMKHIPPNNNTKEMWDSVKIPEDLRTMSCVFDDITHLTSTKVFVKWLQMRPHLPMPACFKADVSGEDKKVPFLIPSDFVFKERDASSAQELALPVSQFSFELKEVLSKLMNQ